MPDRIRGTFLWPLRRFFDPRFSGLAEQLDAVEHRLGEQITDLRHHIDELHLVRDRRADEWERELDELRNTVAELRNMIAADLEAANEATVMFGESLAEIRASIDSKQT
jgi:hypothetical protein